MSSYYTYNAFRYSQGSDTTAVRFSGFGSVTAYGNGYNGSNTTNINGTNVAGAWLQIQSPNGFNVTKYIVESGAGWNNYLNSWSLVASNNGTTFTLLDSQQNININNNTEPYRNISNTNYYTYHRLVMTNCNFDSAVLSLLQLYGNSH